jgi:hypothetical protein
MDICHQAWWRWPAVGVQRGAPLVLIQRAGQSTRRDGRILIGTDSDVVPSSPSLEASTCSAAAAASVACGAVDGYRCLIVVARPTIVAPLVVISVIQAVALGLVVAVNLLRYLGV